MIDASEKRRQSLRDLVAHALRHPGRAVRRVEPLDREQAERYEATGGAEGAQTRP